MSTDETVTVATGAGMLALWRGSAFADVDGYDAWEERVNERLADAIAAGELVPILIRGDGAFGVRVAVAPDGPTSREDTYTFVTSDPYLLVSDGGAVVLSGVETVGEQAGALRLSLPEGRYAVRIRLIAWDDEPGARDDEGRPVPGALPDFLVLVAPSDGREEFRTSEVTFERPA